MKPAILLISNFLSGSGKTQTYSEELASRLRHANWQITTTSHIPERLFRMADMLWNIWYYRNEYQVAHVDIFSGWGFVWAEVTCALLRWLKKPYILTLHGGNLPVFASRQPIRVRRLLVPAALVTVPSGYLLDAMKEYRTDLYLLSNAIDVNNYPYRLREHPSSTAIWLRSFHAIYNPSSVPHIVAQLIKKGISLKVMMVGLDKGDGSLQETQKHIEEFGLQEKIEIIKGIPKAKVPDLLNRGDIFINTTNIDNTPVSVMEAMACGLCIVSTNVGGIPYLLEDGVNALLVPPNDVKAMSDAVTRILTEPELAGRLSQNARKKAEQYDWLSILPKWETFFEEVINV